MTNKWATLNKICHKGDNLLTVKCEWNADELYILIIDGATAWTGKYSAKEIKTFCEAVGITTEEYILECQDVLSNTNKNGKFSFVIENNRFIWKKEVDTDITVKFGSIKLSPVPLIDTLQSLLDFAIEKIEYYKQEAHAAKKKQQYSDEVRTELVSKLKKHEEEKTQMENILYCKFLSLLNTKKERIKDLEQEISDLTSKTVNKEETQESEINDKNELKIKDQISSKKISQSRKRSKNILQPTAHISTVDNLDLYGLSENQSDSNDVNTTSSKGKELLVPKRNVGKKGRHDIKSNSNENTNYALKKEDIELLNDKPFTVHELHPSNLKDFHSDKLNVIHDKSAAVPGASNLRVASCDSASECYQSVKNDVSSSAKCSVEDEHSKMESLDKSPNKLLTHLEKKTEIIYTRSQVRTNVLSKIPDVICPIDLVSDKTNTQSNIKQNNKSISTISVGKKKVELSPLKQRKDFEIISPLDLLNTTHSPPQKRSASSLESQIDQKKNCLKSTVTHMNNTGGSVFTENKKNVPEPYLENLYDMETQCEDPLDTVKQTTCGMKLIDSKTELGATHYDSETDVDETEDSFRSPNSVESITNAKENRNQIMHSSVLQNIAHNEDRDTCNQKVINVPGNILNDSLDSDNSSMELIEPALPKRTHRSDRIKKYVPVDYKNINHFTRLGELRQKSENTASEVQAPIFDQDTQIVDTQKLLDEL